MTAVRMSAANTRSVSAFQTAGFERICHRHAHPEITNPDPEKFEVGSLGFLVLKRKSGETITREQIEAIQREIDEEEFQRAMHPRRV